MKIFAALVLCLILTSVQNFAQGKNNYKLMGVVVESVSGSNLAYVNVAIISRKNGEIIGGSTTDDKGYFTVDKIPERVIRARFSMVGYQTMVIDSISLDNTSRIGIVKLNAASIVMPEVVIKTIKPMIEFKVDKQVINIDQVPGSKGSLTDVLKNTGLVDVDPQSNSISVRGQAVQLQMDGHPYEMPDNSLSQLPASMVNQVEVVLSPGARESAEGGTYILNIISKKTEFDNFNGSVDLSAASNKRNGGGLNLNYKINKLNLFTSGYVFSGDMGYISTMQQNNYNSIGFHYLNSNSSNNSKMLFGNIKTGFDYDLDANNSFTFSGTYTRFKRNSSTNSSSFVENNLAIPVYNYSNTNNSNLTSNNFTLYGFYKKKFSKSTPQSTLPERELTLDAYFSNNYNPSSNDLNTMYSYQFGIPQLHKSRTVENANTFIFKAEYIVPLEIGRFETGYNFTYRHRQNDNNAFDFSYLINAWQDSMRLSNLFRYKENINAAYLTYSKDLGKFGIKGGIRVENLSTVGKQVTTNQNFDHDFLNFFPNLNLSYNLSQLFQINFNAFRRVRYPELYYINPFKTYNGPNNYRAGNPDLQPYYTNSYALSFSQYVNVYYNSSAGLYQYVTANLQDSITYNSPVNLSSNKVYGIDLSFPYYNSPMALFRLPGFITMFNIRFTYRYNKSTGIFLNEDLSDWGYSKSLNASVGVKLWYGIDASMYLYYTPRTESKKYISDPNAYFSIYLSKSFLNEKLMVNMYAEVLNYKYDRQTFGTDFYSHYNTTMQNGRGISLSITYMFNNYKERRERTVDDGRDASGESVR